MKERFLTPSAIILMLIKNEDGREKVLLQRRQNTGFADGMWDLSCSGHVEHGESMADAAVREAKEELGIIINKSDLRFVTLIHKYERERDLTYYNGYFVCENYLNVPAICEPQKCSELKWFDISSLPCDLIPDRKLALQALKTPAPYIEVGWNR
jgi:8-oxo-dGTP pyrophosphatase MutT (NUDIX family)